MHAYRSSVARAVALGAVAVLAGCSSGSGGTSFAGGLQSSNSATVAVNPSGASVAMPSAAGYSGTLGYSSNNAAGGATATLTTTTNAIAVPNPQPAGTVLADFTVVLNQTLTFASGITVSPINMPPTVNTSGHTFHSTVYDLTAGSPMGSAQTGIVSGNSVNFSNGGGAVTLSTNHTYVVVLSYT